MSDVKSLRQVLAEYGLDNAKCSLLSDKGKKSVWKIETSNGYAVLKKMPGSPSRTSWLARAVDHLGRSGVNLAPLIPSLKGSLSVTADQSGFILYRWLSGRQPEFNRDLDAILESMACFHRGGKGFQLSPEEHMRSHLGKWQDDYAKKRIILTQIRDEKCHIMFDKFSRQVFKYINYFIDKIVRMEKQLKASCYKEWVNRLGVNTCFCHQDFSPKNLRWHEGKVYIFDYDSLTLDIPARDIRKLINKLMKKKSLDKILLNNIYQLYNKYNQITESEWRVVLTDLLFPHLFYGIVTKYYFKRAQDWSKEKYIKKLESMINVELEKDIVLSGLI
jgi:spore coat-associated protein S